MLHPTPCPGKLSVEARSVPAWSGPSPASPQRQGPLVRSSAELVTPAAFTPGGERVSYRCAARLVTGRWRWRCWVFRLSPQQRCFLSQKADTNPPMVCYYPSVATPTKWLGPEILRRGDSHVIWKPRICGDPEFSSYPSHGRHPRPRPPGTSQTASRSPRRTPRHPGLGRQPGAQPRPGPRGPRHPHPAGPLRQPRRLRLAFHQHPETPGQTHLPHRPRRHRPDGGPGNPPGGGAGLAAPRQPLPPGVGLVPGARPCVLPGTRKRPL